MAGVSAVAVGWPAPGVVLKILTNGEQLEAGQALRKTTTTSGSSSSSSSSSSAASYVLGEVCTQGPHVMAGYWEDAAATRKVRGRGGGMGM